MAEHDDVMRRHGFHGLTVKDVVQETADTRSIVLDVPADLRDLFTYLPGQYCSFRVRLGEDEQARCYSMSSAPGVDADLTVTVKRVPGGIVSNWLNDNVAAGDTLEVTAPAGTFCLQDSDRPVIGFCGGSGVTPVISIAKSVLADSSRSVAMLYANRDADNVILGARLAEMAADPRFELKVHLDSDNGFLTTADVAAFVGDRIDSDFYICGPGPFMDLVEAALTELGADPAHVFVERFVTPADGDTAAEGGDGGAIVSSTENLTIILKRRKHEIEYRQGDTVLEAARRAGLTAPFSCEGGSCATCMALVKDGTAVMRANFALTPEEIDEGWTLTCQAIPTSESVVIEYEHL